jgi:hypothetical protein
MRYEDFRLQIALGPTTGYVVHAQAPRGGEGREAFVPPKPGQSPEAIGARLFEALFPGKILRLYERSVDALAGDPEAGLRIKLMFDPSDPDLAALQALPWELLRQPGTPDFLALSRRRPVIRYLEIPRPVYAAPRPQPFRIVVVASNPEHEVLGKLDLARELRNLKKAVRSVQGLEVVTPEAPTLAALRKVLRKKDCHALHFMGHGGEISGQSEGVLYFAAGDGRAQPVRGPDLVNKLVDFPSIRLIVLNACESAAMPEMIEPFAGVANSLVLSGVPAVIAMQHPISDEAAIAFSRAFYQSLAAGDPIDAAVAEGRQGVHSRAPAEADWATPILYMRTPTGELFPENDILANSLLRPQEAGTRIHEPQIDLRGPWRGSWENLVEARKGEEIINVVSQKAGAIEGNFVDSANQIQMQFEGEFRFGYLFVRYWAAAGQKAMQDGFCCLRLLADGTLSGHYADLSGCGTYELKLDQPRQF